MKFVTEINIEQSKVSAGKSQLYQVAVPFKNGMLDNINRILILDSNNNILHCNACLTQSWFDGSVRWAVVEFSIPKDCRTNKSVLLHLTEAKLTDENKVVITEIGKGYIAKWGNYKVEINALTGEVIVGKGKPLNFKPIINIDDQPLSLSYIEPAVVKTHENKADVTLKYKGDGALSHIELIQTLRFRSYFSAIETHFTIHNSNAAIHEGGLWDLGDIGSELISSFSVEIKGGGGYSLNLDEKSYKVEGKLDLTQHGSGGENWLSPAHILSSGDIPIEHQGYELHVDEKLYEGLRANPSLEIESHNISIVPTKFWQNFPSAVKVTNKSASVALMAPLKYEHELQAGEKKSYELWLIQSADIQDKNIVVRASVPYKYLQSTAAVDVLGESTEKKDIISEIIVKGLNGTNNFFRKREQIDEYGWRNFGDIFADHETLGENGKNVNISHYNNQYDPLYGFLIQFLTTGDHGWFELADDLARHVKDIDIYDTTLDRDEYNQGLFWHTDHYLDASTCGHRTFSKNHAHAYEGYTPGGGPGGQHCYTTGLKLHNILTGEESSKQCVLQLTNWITYSFEGSNSIFAKLLAIKKSGAHGIKNHVTGQYPLDRGTGHYIVALLDAYDLTKSENYLVRAFKVLSNTIHPNDDISSRGFADIEATWFYTVFLQSVGRFLQVKEKINQLDDDFYYARDAMLHYAAWMLKNELPYLEQAEKLEFPNTTWTGQDLRKVGIFYMADYYSPIKNKKFQNKATYFNQHIITTLHNDINNDCTRILALLMQNLGFARFYQYTSPENPFEAIREYQKPRKVNKINKIKKICIILFRELFLFSIKNELKWLRLRSAKVAKLLGEKAK